MRSCLQKILLSFLCLACLRLCAQPPFHQSNQFDRAVGLTETPERMVQDGEGFLWLGTRHGLFRFDGVQAVKVNHLPGDSLPEAASNIYGMSFDPKKQLLWLGTEHGIFRYDLRSGRSEHLQASDFFEEEDISHKGSHIIFIDRQGETWADFGVYGLVHFIDKGKKAESFYLQLSEREKAAGLDDNMANTVRAISQDANDDNILWLGSRRGLLKFDKAAKRLERFIFYTENEGMLIDANSISRVVAHPNGCIYLSSWDAGLLKFDPKTASFSQFFRTSQGWTDAGNTNRIGALVLNEAGNLWTDGSGGGSLFDVKNERFTTPPMPDFNVDFRDRDGNFWQFKSGLHLFHRRKNQLQKHPVPDFVACEHLSELPFDSRRRQIFLRSHCQNGLWALDVDNISWRQYPLPGRVGEVVELSAYGESPAGFFISDEKDRLYLRAAGSDEFRLVPVSFPARLGNWNLQSRADGDLFITGHEGWLFWLKPPSPAAGRKDWQVKTFSKSSSGGTLPDHFYGVSTPTFDQRGRLWLHTIGGFSIFSPEEGSFLHVSRKQEGVKHLDTYDFFQPGGQGKMWVSGNGGFGWLDPSKPEAGLQKLYGPGSGFPYPNVGIAFLLQEKLWLRVKDGLVEFDPETEKYRLFDFLKSDNIRHLGEGKVIAFVGKGYHVFSLDSLQMVEEQPKPYVSWFKVFEKRVPISGGLLSPTEIRLRPGENFFSFGFSALAWHDPQHIKFAYQLEGLNEDWVFAEPGVLAASYTNIGGGDYVFKVKTTNSRGQWSERHFELKIHVGTPWYKTKLAYLAYLLLLAGGVFAAWRFQKNKWETAAALRSSEQEAHRLTELDAFKSRFFTNITHEFRTPLTVMLGMAEEMKLEIGNWKIGNWKIGKLEIGKLEIGKLEIEKLEIGKLERHPISQYPNIQFLLSGTEAIARNGRQLLQLVNQMLDLARLESGKLVLHTEQADVMQFAKITVEAFQSLAVSKKQNLACLCDPAEFRMDFDPQRLQQILGNLVSNALKFTPEFGSVKVFARADSQRLRIEVQDTGIGIGETEQALIFDRFSAVSTSSANSTGGSTGIGLALAKELAELMGGSISVESKPGEGSRFEVVLPVTNLAELADLPPLPAREAILTATGVAFDELAGNKFPDYTPVLLHVEDNPDLLNYLRSVLGGSYQILAARNGREGLEKALEHVPDVILSDVMMPEMDGFELCEKLKTDLRTSHVPVVLLTAKASVQDKIEGLQHGADAYLMKPFQREELLAVLKNLMENRRRLAAWLAADKLPEAPASVTVEHEFLQKIRRIIEENLSDETYDIARLSRDLTMSRMQLHRKLTALTGKPASLFVRSQRLQKAKALLETTEMNVSEIAWATGFSDHAWFSRCFREEFGRTPSEVRK